MGLKSIMSLGRKSGKQDSTATGTVTFQESLPSSDINAASKESIPMNSWRESRMVAPHETSDAKCDMMVNHIFSQQTQALWHVGTDDEGVVIKKSRGQYVCCPSDLVRPDGFFDAVKALNVKSAMTVNTRVIKLLIQGCDRDYIPIRDDLRLQILPNMASLANCAKHQFAAFIADRGVLVVWDDRPEFLVRRAEELERSLMAMIWSNDSEDDLHEKGKGNEVHIQELDISGSEENLAEKPRRLVLLNSFTTALTLCLTTVVIGLGYQKVVIEIKYDNSYLRLALLLSVPPTVWLALFFFQALVGDIFQIFGPISQITSNTKFYSGLPPKRLSSDEPLPHITIQCPVYKEGLQSVIEPTVQSIKAAISTYEMQGGTANIFINDDGLQLVSPEEARARQDFYEEHSIGWVARPRHDPKGEYNPIPFVRRGKFKKASNMNYALWVSNRVEDKMSSGPTKGAHWSNHDEVASYAKALEEAIEEDEGRTWADGNIRMGDYILLIDSDTRVPTDCLLDAVSEMTHSPQVAVLQYISGVMNVTDSYFEKGITFFTNLVYTQIRYAVANGDVAPFVGHNAVLRWSAVQDIAYDCEDDAREKYWSEATVSEDFDMALRLQNEGYLVRLGGYTGDGFKEGVSLTVYDELARWEKYAYGCNELVFHPLRYWPTRGPFTKLFRNFITSRMPLPSKITIMAYIGTYYALGSAWILTTMNYFIVGWYNTVLDKYYLNSFQVYLAIVVVFTGLGNVALAILRYRIGDQSMLRALATNFMWIPLMTVFLGGISLHVSQALLSHMFGIEMNWGATSKEAENRTFFREVPKVIKQFRVTFVLCILLSVGMVVLARVVPVFWRIDAFFAIYPIASVVTSHFLLPIALNPSLMLFKW